VFVVPLGAGCSVCKGCETVLESGNGAANRKYVGLIVGLGHPDPDGDLIWVRRCGEE
jgi:hypothetical protein